MERPRRPFRRYWPGSPNPARDDPLVRRKIGDAVSRALTTRKEFGRPVGAPRKGEVYENRSVNFEGKRVLDLRRQGHSIRAIADLVGWSKNTVWAFLKRHGGGGAS